MYTPRGTTLLKAVDIDWSTKGKSEIEIKTEHRSGYAASLQTTVSNLTNHLLLITSPNIAHCLRLLLITSPYIAHCMGACTAKGS